MSHRLAGARRVVFGEGMVRVRGVASSARWCEEISEISRDVAAGLPGSDDRAVAGS